MTSEFSNFAARLRAIISSEGRVQRDPDCNRQDQEGDSWNSSLRKDTSFNALALELFTLQFTHNAPYRRLCEVQGALPGNVRHWRRIPAVPTAAFKELELTCLPSGERTAVFHSSGTTEQRPSRHFHSAESLSVYEASLWTWFERSCWWSNASCRLLVLTPPPAQAPHSSLVHMFDFIRRKTGVDRSAFVGHAGNGGAWELDCDAALEELRRANETGEPVLLLGTAFSFVHLLDFLVDKNLRFELPSDSRVVETGGYKGRSRSLPKTELHALMTERLGVSTSGIVCEYGMSELSSQAYDSIGLAETGRHFHFPPWTRMQIISPETGREVADGETGLIRVFDLANVFSVMAVQTEDLAIRRGGGFELVGRAELAEPRGCSLMAV